MAELITGLSAGAAFALVAVGVVLIYKSTGALSIAQGEIGAFGFLYGLRWAERGLPLVGWHIPRIATLLVAVVIAAGLGLLAEQFIMRPLVQRPPLDGLIATLGIALFLALAELQLFGTAQQRAPSAVGEWKIKVLGATLVSSRVVAFLLTGLAAYALYLFFARTKFGLAVLATTSNPVVARILGVPVNQVYRFAWGTACALSGVAAALLGPAFGGVAPFDLTKFALAALAGAVIGGLDSVWGAIVGSLIVGVVAQVAGATLPQGADSVAILALVLVTLLVRPRGLLGTQGVA